MYDQQLQPHSAFEKPDAPTRGSEGTSAVPPRSAVLHRDLHKDTLQVVKASGLYFELSDGRRIIDATGGAAVSCIGHGDTRVRDAMASQVAELDYCHSLFFSCPPSEALARTLVDSTHGRMSRAFIVNSGKQSARVCWWYNLLVGLLMKAVGSEAMDGAVKLARQYFMELSPPQPQRIRFIAREGSYHGNTLGALSISGHKARRSIYEPMLTSNISHVSACNEYRGRNENETIQAYVARLAEELDLEFQRVGPETVCAFVAEPVVGAVSSLSLEFLLILG